MKRRFVPLVAVFLACFVAGGGDVSAQYDYGGSSSYRSSSDGGLLFFIETILTNPRNADNVVASNASAVVIPVWDEELAGRIGGGYRWDGGKKIVFTIWGFDIDVNASGGGATFEFPIGPTSGTSFATTTEITARTLDAAFAVEHQATRELTLEWSIGLRHASFEEVTTAVYDGAIPGLRSNEGTMLGPRFAGKATYRASERISFDAGLGFSMLDGELEGRSGVGAAIFGLSDDGRSGTILDAEVAGAWHNATENVRIVLGWETSIWEDIADDLFRNQPAANFPLRSRDSVTFSGVKAGIHFRF